MKKLAFTGLLLAAFLTYSCEQPERTEEETAQETTEATGLAEEDRDFLQETAKEKMFNIELARLAQERAVTEEVREYANNVQTEHQNIHQELAQFAEQRNVFLPDSLDEDQREDLNELAQEEGFDFDEEFMDRMVERNRDAVDRFEDRAENTEDEQLRQWAQNTVPALRTQVETAENVEEAVERQREAQQES
ncbi:DUF4142 domain-containing protein [Cytophagaceae bacterium ABcell3]|nr:DUF4142 domain-containing protein [Cytophagaceae bacterium ABcell3]